MSVRAGGRREADAASAPAAHWPAFPSRSRVGTWRAFRERNVDTPELDARLIVGHALGLDHTALAAQSGRVLVPRGGRRHRRAGGAPAARASRWRAFSAARSSGGCRCGSTRRRWCRGRRPRPWSRRRWLRCRRRHRTLAIRCASPISAPARARCCWRCFRNCRTLAGSAPISASPRSAARATMPPRSACLAVRHSWPAITAPRSRDRSTSWCPIRPMSRARRSPASQPEVRDYDPRRALDGGPDGLDGYRAIAAARAAACSRRTGVLVGGTRRGAGDRRGRDSYRGGACAGRRSGTILRASPRALVVAPQRHEPTTFLAAKKSAWIVGQDRLGFGHGIDPRLLSADSEPRSRTAESRRCERSERRTPDDPAESSPNRDEMLHRFGADPRARRTCRVRKRWATPRYAAVKGLLLHDTESDIAAKAPYLTPA